MPLRPAAAPRIAWRRASRAIEREREVHPLPARVGRVECDVVRAVKRRGAEDHRTVAPVRDHPLDPVRLRMLRYDAVGHLDGLRL